MHDHKNECPLRDIFRGLDERKQLCLIRELSKNGKISKSPVRSIIANPRSGIAFYRVKTASGKELIADGQRALYVTESDSGHHRLVRVEKLKTGIKIISVSEGGTETELDEVMDIKILSG